MFSPIASVCIPTFNEKGYVERTLKNLTSQSLYKKGKVEIIIGDYKDELNMDDDYLINVCRKYEHVRYIPVFQKGIPVARNTIVNESHSNIIVNFDADSIYSNFEGLETMIRPIVDREVKLTNCECILYNYNTKEIMNTSPKPNLYGFLSNIGTTLEKYMFARGPSLCVDKEAFYKVGGFREVPVAEDYWLSVDVCLEYSIHAKRYIDSVKVYTSDRRAKAIDTVGAVDVFNYGVHSFR